MNADERFVHRESENIIETVEMIEELLALLDLSRYGVIALGTLLQNAYTGVERILRFDIERCGKRVEKSESWHKDLLVKSREEHLIDDSQFNAFGALLAFRHVHMHGYGHMLDEARLRGLAADVPTVVREYLGSRKS